MLCPRAHDARGSCVDPLRCAHFALSHGGEMSGHIGTQLRYLRNLRVSLHHNGGSKTACKRADSYIENASRLGPDEHARRALAAPRAPLQSAPPSRATARSQCSLGPLTIPHLTAWHKTRENDRARRKQRPHHTADVKFTRSSNSSSMRKTSSVGGPTVAHPTCKPRGQSG